MHNTSTKHHHHHHHLHHHHHHYSPYNEVTVGLHHDLLFRHNVVLLSCFNNVVFL